MATTPLDVFSIAMNLMGEGNETTGATDTADNLEYKNRTLALLNILQQEVLRSPIPTPLQRLAHAPYWQS